MFVWPHNEIILGPSWELGAYNLQHRGYRGTQVGVGNLDFCNIVGPNWELGIWEFIAKNDIVGGHLGKQNKVSHLTGWVATAGRGGPRETHLESRPRSLRPTLVSKPRGLYYNSKCGASTTIVHAIA